MPTGDLSQFPLAVTQHLLAVKRCPLAVNECLLTLNECLLAQNQYPEVINGCPLIVNDCPLAVTGCPLVVNEHRESNSGRRFAAFQWLESPLPGLRTGFVESGSDLRFGWVPYIRRNLSRADKFQSTGQDAVKENFLRKI